MTEEKQELSFLDHLEELRWRIFKSIIAIVAFALPCGFFWKNIFDVVMLYPLRLADPAPRLIITSPAEAVVLTIKIAVTGGIIFASPVIFYQFWRFISPGLYKNERVLIIPVVVASTLFFLFGISFSYLSVPYVISFLTRFASDKLEAMYRTQEYLGFLIKLGLAFGVVFELPVLSFVLTKAGILTPKFLIRNIRYAIVIVFVLAAVLTPPDIVSQMFLAVPLIVLYCISIIVSFCVVEKKSV